MKRIVALFLATLMLFCVLSGCAEKETIPSTSTSTGESTPAASSGEKDPIKVGVLSLETGNLATMGMNCYYATVIATNKVNAAGGINGRMIELEFADTAGNLTEGVELAKKFADDPDISMIFGPVRGVEGASVCPVTNDAKIVTLLPITSQNDLGLIGDYVWVGCSEQRVEQPGTAKVIASNGVKRLAVLYKNTEWGVNSVEGFKDGAAETDMEIIATEPYAENETDFTTVLTKLRALEPDAIYMISEITDGVTILTQMQQLGWDIDKYASGSMYNEQVVENSAEGAAEGLICGAIGYVPTEGEFATEFQEMAGFPPAIQAVLSYDSVLVMAHALKIADDNGDLSRDGIAKAFTQFGEITEFNGIPLLAEKFAFAENHSAIKEVIPLQIVNGKFERID